MSGPTKKQSLPVWCYEQPNTPESAKVRAVCTFSGTPAIEEEPVFSLLFPTLNKAGVEDIVFNTLCSEHLFQKWHAFYSIYSDVRLNRIWRKSSEALKDIER